MRKRLREVIAEVLQTSGSAMSSQAILDDIQRQAMFTFNTPNPLMIVSNALRRYCEGVDRKSYHLTKHFSKTTDGRYRLLSAPVKSEANLYTSSSPAPGGATETLVTVPPDEDDSDPDEPAESKLSHSEIQWRLLDLGSRMGFTVWAPRNDRGKSWQGRRLGEIPSMIDKLPLGFDSATVATIEYIDVLWMRRHSIIAGFEVEHTSSIYSGLLRMSDLAAMQPDLVVKLYLVAPDEREAKFAREITRPTFVYGSLTRPLHTTCRFLPYSALIEALDRVDGFVHHLKPDFLDEISELYDPNEE